MKEFARDVLRLLPLLGAIGLMVAVAYSRSLSETLRSDDGHVIGLVVSVALLPSLLGLLLARHCRWSQPKPQIAFMLPLAVLGAGTVYVISTAELHGPGIAFIIFAFVVLGAAPIYFVVPKVLSSSKLRLVLGASCVLWLVAYASAVAYMTSR